MKDKEVNLEEIESSHTLGGVGEGGVQGRGKWRGCTYYSVVRNPGGHSGTDTRSGIWLRNKPTDLSACVSEERGHGEGGVAYATLLSAYITAAKVVFFSRRS
jgi:hypothetical protein